MRPWACLAALLAVLIVGAACGDDDRRPVADAAVVDAPAADAGGMVDGGDGGLCLPEFSRCGEGSGTDLPCCTTGCFGDPGTSFCQ